MTHHDLSRTTHTPELRQVHELNEHLADADRAGTPVTAEALGLAGAPIESGDPAAGGLPASAALDHLSPEGPPDFPYIEGRFRATTAARQGAAGQGAGGTAATVTVTMHTAALRRLSQRFGLHHVWGA